VILEDELKRQIELVKESANLISTLKDSIKFKDEQIKTLERTLKLKEEQLRVTSSSSIDKHVLEEKNKTIEDLQRKNQEFQSEIKESRNKIEELQKKIEILDEEFAKADEALEKLELESEKLKKNSQDTSIINFTNYKISKTQIIEKIRDILQRSLHNVTLSVPVIVDLQDLYLYDVKSSVKISIYCSINKGIKEHAELLDEFESLDNISIRDFEGQDRYVIMKDGDELLFAVIGNSESNHLCFHTQDPAHIKFFNTLVIEGWMRSRKV